MHIIYVEDESDLASLVKKYLEREGYTVTLFSTGEAALKVIQSKVDLWILDIMLEDEMSGYDLIKIIKEKTPDVPVIFTSARDHDIDKIMGFELGSDDYLSKPYSPRELILRVKAILKRSTPKMNNEQVNIANYHIYLTHRVIKDDDEEIRLTHKEFDLLLLLVKHINQPVSRADILENVWEKNYFGSDRVVDDLVRRLRVKMPRLTIETIYGHGYRLS